MGLKIKTLLVLLLVLTVLTGCSSRQIVLHPIEKADIFRMEVGQKYKPEKSGWFVSDFYVEEVMKAKVE